MKINMMPPCPLDGSSTKLPHAASVLLTAACAMLGLNYLLYNYLDLSDLKNYVRVAALALVVLSYLFRFRQLGPREMLFGLIAMYALLTRGSASFNIAVLVLLAMSIDVKKDRLYDRLHMISLVLVVLAVCGLLFGAVKNVTTDYNGRLRNLLGFSNENAAASFYFSYLLIFLLSRKRIRWPHLALAAILGTIVYHYTDSRTSIISLGVFLLLYILMTAAPRLKIGGILTVLEVLLFATPFVWSLIGRLYPGLDGLLSMRVRVNIDYVAQHSVLNLFLGGSTVGEVDNTYLVLLYAIGLPLYTVFAGSIIRATRNMYRQGKTGELAFVISGVCSGLMESNLLRVEILSTVAFWCTVFCYFRRPEPPAQPNPTSVPTAADH